MYSMSIATPEPKKHEGDQGIPNPSSTPQPASGIPSPYPISGVSPGKWNTRLSHCCDDVANCKCL